jgi:peptide/nickel transport system ATP-binding protein
MSTPVLELDSLSVGFATDRGLVRAVEAVSFRVMPGRMLAVVGESGCGKSVTALAVMGLLPDSAQVGGRILFDGRDAREAQRGRDLAMVFQEPMTSLNPAFTAGEQVAEALRRHRGLAPRAAFDAAVEMLTRAQIPDAARRARQYPHQLSGGMRQRVMIAMALACRPRLLLCDEPTTALDVTVQAQIMALLDELRAETGTAVVLITHDLGVVADRADDVAVMYAGRVVEAAPAAQLFAAPQHPYTVGLLGAAPRLAGRRGRLASIEGTVPDPLNLPPGCRFAPRCPFAVARCNEPPPLAEVTPGHTAACWRAPLDQVLAA